MSTWICRVCAWPTPRGVAARPDDPQLMVRILLYGYNIGVRSSRVIETKCINNVPFRWPAAGAFASGHATSSSP